MNVLIAYATQSGVTARCAHMLASHFPHHNVTLFDLRRGEPDLAAYDLIFIGAPIRMGRWHKSAVSLMARGAEVLAKRPYALFVCCASYADYENAADMLSKSLPPTQIKGAVAVSCLGGELNVADQKGLLSKLLTYAMRRAILNSQESENAEDRRYLPSLLPENISRLADKTKRFFTQ